MKRIKRYGYTISLIVKKVDMAIYKIGIRML